jgi:molybdopterin molybdotransferase
MSTPNKGASLTTASRENARELLLPVAEAERVILRNTQVFPSVSCPLEEAVGRVLAADVVADRDMPPFHRVTMDGIAVALSAWKEGVRAFRVEGVQPAGNAARALRDAAGCMRVMTGAILPRGTDCVIPREHVVFRNDRAEVTDGAEADPMKFVHPQGVDARAGDVVLRRGMRLRSPEILIAASVGRAVVDVTDPPAVAVVSTGDEIVAVAEAPEPHQIRDANAFALQAALKATGVRCVDRCHFPDNREVLVHGVAGLLASHRVLVFTGGVSAGDYDYLPGVFRDLRVRQLFHKVRQRPGKPFWFGLGPAGQAVFALPGNPVSTLVCCHRYIRPWLLQSMGMPPPAPERAVLAIEVRFPPALTHFLQVRDQGFQDGLRRVEPVAHHGSGDYASLQGTLGFVELDEQPEHFPAGTVVPLYPWS